MPQLDVSNLPASPLPPGEVDSLALVNAHVLTFDTACPRADCVVIRRGRVARCGSYDQLRPHFGSDTPVIDVEGRVVAPAFHDAHLHFLSYARWRSRLDCRDLRSLPQLQVALRRHADVQPDRRWLRAVGYDHEILKERRHPHRGDLDRAVLDRPVRLQHRSLHLEVLNTLALRRSGLWDSDHPSIEREAGTGEPTGRLYHAAELLRDRVPHAEFEELAADVRHASQRLLAWGVTSIQDATVTNGPQEWALFGRLAVEGHLPLRTVVFAGARHWREVTESLNVGGRVRLGPVKLMVNEAAADLTELRETARWASAAGRSVAIHATSEAEVALALDLVRNCARPAASPHRIEHGSVIPDPFLAEIHSVGVAVIGQPTLIELRGDAYRAEYPPELHGWLHRAQSLIDAGILYAVGSDAPVTDPIPGRALFAARQRRTGSGVVLGLEERLNTVDALQALTLGPARAIGSAHELGHLRPGALADLVVLDPEQLAATSPEDADRPVWMTIMDGRVVWSRPL